MAGGVVPPLPGRMQRLPFTKAGGTDAPYSSTSGLKALERSYTVPILAMHHNAMQLHQPAAALPAQAHGLGGIGPAE